MSTVPEAKLVVDTDVASYIFKWHPSFAPAYVRLIRGHDLVLSFMTVAEMRHGALAASWGARKRTLLETYLADFAERTYHQRDGRLDCRHSIGPVCSSCHE